MTDFNPYTTLGLQRDADALAIKTAWRKLSQANHPDRGGDAARMAEINRAYELLSDAERRRRYDNSGDTGQAMDIMERARAESRVAIAQFLEQHGPEANILTLICNTITRGNRELEGRIRKCDAKIAQLEQRRAYVKRKDKSEETNIFVQVIEDVMARTKAEKLAVDDRLKLNLAALEVLKEYEFDGPKVEGGPIAFSVASGNSLFEAFSTYQRG